MDVFSQLDPEVTRDLILPRLDGKSLIVLSAVSHQFEKLIQKVKEEENSDMWRNICISTWPSLQDFLSTIFLLPGGYRSFFLDVFPSIHPPINAPPPPPPPNYYIFLAYAVDIFLDGEQKPFYSLLRHQTVDTLVFPARGFRFNLYDEEGKMNSIKVTREGCFDYLKQNLRLSCVAIDPSGIKRAVSLIPGGSPVEVRDSLTEGQVLVVFEWPLLVPVQLPYPDEEYTKFVRCRVEVRCNLEGDGEDLSVNFIYLTMVDALGKAVRERHGAVIIQHAIQNGKRKGRRTAVTLSHGDSYDSDEEYRACLENLDLRDEEDPDPFMFE